MHRYWKIKLPISVEVASAMFSIVAIDSSLAKSSGKKRRKSSGQTSTGPLGQSSTISSGQTSTRPLGQRRTRGEAAGGRQAVEAESEAEPEVEDEHDDEPEAAGAARSSGSALYDASKGERTVSFQTYQNYKSALKWWHCLDSPEMDKVGQPWPATVETKLAQMVAAYKRRVGVKKRAGLMPLKDGKRPYNLDGYTHICKFFMTMTPQGKKYRWYEGMFAIL